MPRLLQAANGSSTPVSPHREIAVWSMRVVLGLLVLGGAFLLDDYCLRHWRAAPGSMAYSAARIASRLLDWPWVFGAMLVGWRWGQFVKKPSMAAACYACLVAGILCGGTSTLLRCAMGRTRPRAEVPQGWYGPWSDGHLLVGVATYNAFPSGHTATIAGMAVLALRRRLAFRGILVALTIAVAAARIALAAHRFSDIVAALLLAFFLADWVDRCVDWLRTKRAIRSQPLSDARNPSDASGKDALSPGK